MDAIGRYGGVANPCWTLGGETVLSFRHHHRSGKSIGFVSDPQHRRFVATYLSDTATAVILDYTEQRRAVVKLEFEEGG